MIVYVISHQVKGFRVKNVTVILYINMMGRTHDLPKLIVILMTKDEFVEGK